MVKYPEFSSQFRQEGLKSEYLEILPRELIQELGAFVFDKKSSKICIAAIDPENPVLKQFIKERLQNKAEVFLATKEDVDFLLSNLKRDYKNEIIQLAESAAENDENIIKIVDAIMEYAFSERASDIHIEPLRNEIQIRYRIDGMLRSIVTIPHGLQQALIARIKIISNLKIDEYRRPQDGRIEPEKFPNISLRTSIIPTLFGEKIVMRILDDSQKNISVEQLGFSEAQKNIILENIEKPFGMIIASGPTGSGKTTTLYALLRLFKKEGRNISTLEDPIEYVLEGVNQIQINTQAGLTFPAGLRALLRQDPDIMMVGEIRDVETASMAANAAMTGHVVFTTMHTNDAASAFTRFLEMKVDDFVVATTINLVIAQRLVRKVCMNCAEGGKLSEITLKKIHERKDIVEILEKRNLLNDLENHVFLHGRGCDACFQSGYSGRTVIFELMKPNKEIHDLVLNHQSAESIKAAAEKEGFLNMVHDGIDKIYDGKTTFEEVLRTTKNI